MPSIVDDLKWIIKRQKGNLDLKYLKFWSLALDVLKDLNDFLPDTCSGSAGNEY
jgi:hypothetical protein